MRSRELIPAVLQMLEARSAGRTMELMVTDSDVVEQAKGFLREILDISVETHTALRRYAQVHGDQQVRVSRRLMSEPGARPAILAAMRQMLAGPCC